MADSSTLLGVLANDSDPNGDELTITHVESIAIVQSGVVGLSSGANVAMDGGRLEYDQGPRRSPLRCRMEPQLMTLLPTISDGSLSIQQT
ncbi:hypothetical protein [Hyphobacterium sp. CCMP332]|uniref:Ig-like domain-containing protein n=1 Tax=Hyphobacterium sp. CCMP332 TaxID=2749086 RepID=UPI00351C45C7